MLMVIDQIRSDSKSEWEENKRKDHDPSNRLLKVLINQRYVSVGK